MITLLLFVNFLTQTFSFSFSNPVDLNTSLTLQPAIEENLYLTNIENQLKNIIKKDNVDYFLPNIFLSLNKTGIEIPGFNETVFNEARSNINDMASSLVCTLLSDGELNHKDFEPIIKRVTDMILGYELSLDNLTQAGRFFFEDISKNKSHFIRDRYNNTFYIWNTFGIKREIIEEYFLLKDYNSPGAILNLTSSISQHEPFVDKEDIFNRPNYSRNPRNVYEILTYSDATSEEISYVQSKALGLAEYETKIVSVPIMFDDTGTKKISFCMFKDKNTNMWHLLENDILSKVLIKTDILINNTNHTTNSFKDIKEFTNILKENYPSSGLIFELKPPQINSTSLNYYKSQSYINSLLENLYLYVRKMDIELIGIEKIFNMVSEAKFIEISNGIQLFPESMSNLFSKIIISSNKEKPGFLTFSVYNDIVWIQPRLSFSSIGLVMDFFSGTFDMIKKYIKNPNQLRSEIIKDIQKDNLNSLKKYFYIKEKYFNNMEYGILSPVWLSICRNNEICYLDSD